MIYVSLSETYFVKIGSILKPFLSGMCVILYSICKLRKAACCVYLCQKLSTYTQSTSSLIFMSIMKVQHVISFFQQQSGYLTTFFCFESTGNNSKIKNCFFTLNWKTSIYLARCIYIRHRRWINHVQTEQNNDLTICPEERKNISSMRVRYWLLLFNDILRGWRIWIHNFVC